MLKELAVAGLAGSMMFQCAEARSQTCAVVGDSIAVALQVRFLPECHACARGGWNSWQVNRLACMRDPTIRNADVVVIAIGSNDHAGVDSAVEIASLRAAIDARRVVWIMPSIKPRVQEIVAGVAHDWRDEVFYVPRAYDGVHPDDASNRLAAQLVKEH